MVDNLQTMQTPTPTNPKLPPLEPTPPGLYRHYKGGWYEVLDTVRCSETLAGMTLYRALYGDFGLWVRPAAMFAEVGAFLGKTQPRFVRHDILKLVPADLFTAQALVAHLHGLAQKKGLALDTMLRPAPPVPTTCCGRGCNGCMWEYYFAAVRQWRDDACDCLSKNPAFAPPD